VLSLKERVELLESDLRAGPMRISVYRDLPFALLRAEALRELRRQNFTEALDRHFALGAHLNARDTKAVRKTVAGLIKLVYPDGTPTREEAAEWSGSR
jgi:hypothetical protein